VSLAWKIVCSATIPVVVGLGAACMSLVALGGPAAESRRVVAVVGPTVREIAAADENLAALGRLHGRWIAIRSPTYEGRWATQMVALDERLRGLGASLETVPARRHLLKARRALARYRELAATDVDGRLALRELSVAGWRRAIATGGRVRRSLDAVDHELDEIVRRSEIAATVGSRRAWQAMAGIGVLAFALALLLSSWTGGRLVRGLRRLTDASEALERGRLDQPVAIGGRDELARLGGAFERLAHDWGERDRTCEDTVRRLVRDLSEPLVTVRDAARVLAVELPDRLDARQQSLVKHIGESAERLLHRVARIEDDPQVRPALPSPRVVSVELESTSRCLLTDQTVSHSSHEAKHS
jgi:HAMP domain-containing protein